MKFRLDEKTPVLLPGLLNMTYMDNLNPDFKTSTIANSDGLINWLRQPGQLIS